MSLSRRKFLTLIGGGVVVAAGIGAATFTSTRTPTKALAPWNTAGQYADARLRALSYALLAPNPHNRQPWEAELIGDDEVVIWRDEKRDLPVTDPFARQLTIGMGCFLELMKMAAAEEGYGVETALFPGGEDGPVAQCRFVPDTAKADPLFAFVMERRSFKEAFDGRPVRGQAIETLSQWGDIYASGPELEALQSISAEAWMVEMLTEDAYMESIDLMRIGKRQINANPDGIDVGGPTLEALHAVGLFNHETAADMTNPSTLGFAHQTRDVMLACPAFILQKTPSNTRLDQIAAGGKWLRYNLAVTRLGLQTRPVSQALQEYPEMAGHYEAIHAQFAKNGETIQMFGMLGYGYQTPRTPRWALETRLLNA